MNKQEAIDEIKKQSTQAYDDFAIMRDTAIHIVNQIDEPQKVTIPKFVAEYIEKCKRCNLNLEMTLYKLDDDAKVGNWAYGENNDLISEKIDMIARAWLDGYETEQEKLYTVEIPDPNSYYDYRYLSRNDNGIYLDASNDTKWKQEERNQLTEAEIKQDFEWAWQFAKEVE